MRHLAGAVLTLLFVGVVAGPAAAQYPPTAAAGQVTKTTVAPNECVTFSGGGYAPGTTVTITDNGTVIETVTTTEGGSFAAEVCLAVLGTHTLRGVGETSSGAARVVVAQVRVGGAARGAGRGLSRSGSDVALPATALGGLLVLVGAAAMVASRSRRRTVTA